VGDLDTSLEETPNTIAIRTIMEMILAVQNTQKVHIEIVLAIQNTQEAHAETLNLHTDLFQSLTAKMASFSEQKTEDLKEITLLTGSLVTMDASVKNLTGLLQSRSITSVPLPKL
jgi:hypothetical protein